MRIGRVKIVVGYIALLTIFLSGCNTSDVITDAEELSKESMKYLRYGTKVSDTNSNYQFVDSYPHILDMNDSNLRKRLSNKGIVVLFTINNLPLNKKYHLKIFENESPNPSSVVTKISLKDSSWHQIGFFDSSWFNSGIDYKIKYKVNLQDSLVYQDSVELIGLKNQIGITLLERQL